jgi:glycosyltransferase involved in cell wall biosynthesis
MPHVGWVERQRGKVERSWAICGAIMFADSGGRVSSSRPVPIALFFSSFIAGGTEHQMIELSRRLDRRLFSVHLVCFHRSGAWVARAEQNTASITEFPISSFRRADTFHQMRAFARWCRANNIALVHTVDIYANIFGLPAAAAARVPVRIGNRRDINPRKSFAMIALQRAAYACAQRVIANSAAVAARLRREAVPHCAIDIIPNGIDVGAFALRPRGERPLRRVITVANLRPEKAHEVLIDAAASLVARNPDLEFRIVGDGSRLAELTALASARGVGKHVRFFGHRDDVPALLRDSDIFVLPSRSEALPNGLIEAMAAGLPVVATAVGGIVELVQHGKNGLLVRPGNSRDLANAIQQLIDDRGRAAALACEARRSIEACYSFDRMVREFERVYLRELQRRAPVTLRAATQLAF